MAMDHRTEQLMAKMRRFLLPGGNAVVRGIESVETKEIGCMRAQADAQSARFTAKGTYEATRSEFRWSARMQGSATRFLTIVDAYEGRGLLEVKIGGLIPVKRLTGPAADQGELQRYLATVVMVPPLLVANDAIRWEAIGASSLRVWDCSRADIHVDVELDGGGKPVECTALRPRLVGKKFELTRWSAVPVEYTDFDGIRVATKSEARWHLPEGALTAVELEITNVKFIGSEGR
jgi:hypothetical protein